MTSAPQTSVKMVLTHCSAVTEPPRSSEMAVVATGMLAAANQTMAAERHSATSDHQRFAPGTCGWRGGAGGASARRTARRRRGGLGRRSSAASPRAHFCSAIPAMKSASASVQRSSSARSTLSLGAWILHMRLLGAPEDHLGAGDRAEERGDQRDRAALAVVHDVLAVGGGHGRGRRRVGRPVGLGEEALAGGPGGHLHPDVPGGDGLEVRLDGLQRVVGLLRRARGAR